MPEIKLDYVPRQPFVPFHLRKQRFAVIVCHRRAGKTVASIRDLIDSALRLKNERALEHGRFAYVAPYRGQAKEIAWDYLKRFTQPISVEKNEGELWIRLIGGAQIRIHGADNADALRGAYLDGIILDEYASMVPGVYGEVIRPMLTDRRGWAVFIGTPKGKNAFYKRWKEAKASPDRYYSLMLKASESGILSAEELASARLDVTADEYQQEYECSFEAAIRGAFYAEQFEHMEAEGRICRIPIDKSVRVHTGWDLGRTDSTAIWFVQCVGRERRLVDYFESSGIGLRQYAEILYDKKQQHKWIYADHYFPHDIGIHTIDSDLSRMDTLRDLGIEPILVPQHAKLDGINAVRRMLDRTWIDPDRCERGLEALRQYHREYDDKLCDYRPDAAHGWESHGADALRTFAAGYDDPVGVKWPGDRHRKEILAPKESAWSA